MRNKLNKAVDALHDLRKNSLAEIKNILIANNHSMTMTDEIREKYYPHIAYYGGNHPEYASDCFEEVEKIVYDDTNDNIEVHFTEGGIQDLSENSIDDILTIWEILVGMQENFS